VPGQGSRAAMRNWRISTRLVSLLALPVVAATTLGAARIQDSLDNVDQLDNMKLLTQMTEQATQLASALQEERDRSAGPLIRTGNEKDDAVVAPREETDRAFQAFKQATGNIDDDDKVMSGVQSTVLDITRQLTEIKNIRQRAYDNQAYVSQTVNSYNQLIDSLLSLSQDMAQATSNSEMIQSTRALAAFSTAKEYASIQRAIISAGLAHKGGPQLSESDRLYAKTASESEDASLGSFDQIYGQQKAAELTKPLDGGIINITSADKYRDRVLKSPSGIKSENRSYLDWYDQDSTKIQEMGKVEDTLLSQMEQQARHLRAAAQRDALLNGAVILLVLGISLVGAFVVARSMVRSLRRLQDTAQEVSRKRLPELVRQMSEAEPQDVDTSVESVGVHSRDEIGRVAAAFDDVHREAVRLAGEQALLRGNVNAMFTNLSRRSQGLIQRQLSLISELESREADPDQLSSLFKLDHLATRMRRNGENLLVLAGEEPGRRWTRPVPLVDVLRAAASEVEQYERIELNSVPGTEVTGRVVNDLVHLLAELLENATSFSSPQTKVKVTGHALPDGRVLVEIHDTGIGLSPEDLSSINERLANPPTVDVSVSRRMGLFVVGRLSLRHGIRIQLRPSDSGGTTALVMLPVDVAQGGASGAKGKPNAAAGAGSASGSAKGGNLAAALQRGSGAGAPAGAGAAARLGAAPARGQVGGGPRPALGAGSGAGAANADLGGGQGGGQSNGQGGQGTDFFGENAGLDAPGNGRLGGLGSAGRPTTPPAPPVPEQPSAPSPFGGDGPAGELSSGSQGGGRNGQGGQFGQGGSEAPASSPRFQEPDEWGPFPGSAGRPGGQYGQGPGSGGAPEGSGDAAWGGSRPTDDYAASPSDSGTDASAGRPYGSDTTELRRPESSRSREDFAAAQSGGSGEPGKPERPEGWGQLPGQRPGQSFGFMDLGGSKDPEEDQRSGEQQRPSWADQSGLGDDAPRGHEEPEPTGEFARPGYAGASGGGQDTIPGQGRRDQWDQRGQRPQETGGFALPPGRSGQDLAPAGGERSDPQPSYDPDFGIPSVPPPAADAPTPIFESMESNWFQASRPSSPQGYEDSSQASAPRPGGQPASAVPPMAQRPGSRGVRDASPTSSAAGSSAGVPADVGWGASPNDESWRQAEQVRQPAAGGVTTSGLPRRVPRANLVAGTAQQQAPAQSGPQVSRAPDDVRGRLTNLRRGIQQGRQAGTSDGRGFGPTHQQER
jgi:signal transduction histidine kinase